jgi:hypothetical protein
MCRQLQEGLSYQVSWLQIAWLERFPSVKDIPFSPTIHDNSWQFWHFRLLFLTDIKPNELHLFAKIRQIPVVVGPFDPEELLRENAIRLYLVNDRNRQKMSECLNGWKKHRNSWLSQYCFAFLRENEQISALSPLEYYEIVSISLIEEYLKETRTRSHAKDNFASILMRDISDPRITLWCLRFEEIQVINRSAQTIMQWWSYIRNGLERESLEHISYFPRIAQLPTEILLYSGIWQGETACVRLSPSQNNSD